MLKDEIWLIVREDTKLAGLKDQILAAINKTPGLTDREITDRIRGASAIQQPINQACRSLASRGLISRESKRPHDNLIGNYLSDGLTQRDTIRSSNLSREATTKWQPPKTREKFELGGYEFVNVCEIEPVRGVIGDIEALFPQSRYAQTDKAKLHKYGQGPFCKFKIPSGINLPGVYALVTSQRLKYIGRCNSLSKRFNAGYGNISPRNCFTTNTNGQETNCRLNNLIYTTILEGQPIGLWFHPSQDFTLIEKKLLKALGPPWNLR